VERGREREVVQPSTHPVFLPEISLRGCMMRFITLRSP